MCLCVCVNNTPDPFQPNCSSYSKLLIAQKTGPNTIPTSTVVFKKQPSSISFVEMGMLLSQLKWRRIIFYKEEEGKKKTRNQIEYPFHLYFTSRTHNPFSFWIHTLACLLWACKIIARRGGDNLKFQLESI